MATKRPKRTVSLEEVGTEEKSAPTLGEKEGGDVEATSLQSMADRMKQQRRWKQELEASRRETEEFRTDAEAIVKRFLVKGEKKRGSVRRSYFTANVQTQEAVFYGKTPKVDVERKFNDADDDVARVACTIIERILNSDIHRATDEYASAVGLCLWDYLTPGWGTMRGHYRPKLQTVPAKPPQMGPAKVPHPTLPGQLVDDPSGAQVELAPAVPAHQEKVGEDFEAEYVHWKDVLISPARHWGAVRWVAFCVQMSRDDLVKRFGAAGKTISLNTKKASTASALDASENDPRKRADIWEIHSKEDGGVFWVNEGETAILDFIKDPWELEGFWTFPRPMLANTSTSSLVPRADFSLVEDVYDELELTATRINKLSRVIKAVGTYDSNSPELKRLMTEAVDNDLIPSTAWATLSEKGGIAGSISFLPLDIFVLAMEKLLESKAELKQELAELSGMSDLVRGEGDPNATATAEGIKAKFASVRLKRRQDEVARFCTEFQRIKAEIISRHFDEKTILERSNIKRTADAKTPAPPDENGQPQMKPDGTPMTLVDAAIQLIKTDYCGFRIEVKPESVSLEDYASTRNEAGEVMAAIAQFVQSVTPLMQQSPAIFGPLMGEMLQWLIAQVKGGKQIEGAVDRAVNAMRQQAMQPPQQQQPDPKLMAAHMKVQGDLQREQLRTQGALVQIQAQTQADLQHQQNQTKFNIFEAQAKERAKVDAQVDSVINPAGFGGGG